MPSNNNSGHTAHAAIKLAEMAVKTPQGQATVTAATGLVIAAAPVAVPVALTAAAAFGIYHGFRKLREWFG